jgi:hypothetical protein
MPPTFDTFDRGSLGANWTNAVITAAPTIKASTEYASTFLTAEAVGFYNVTRPITLTAYACGKLGGTQTQWAGPCLAAGHGQAVCCEAMGATGWRLHAVTPPFEPMVSAKGATVFAVGDYIGIQRTGVRAFECKRSTNGVTWTGLGVTTIAHNALVAGAGGAVAAGSTASGFTLADWEAADGSLPASDRPCGSASTTTSSTTSTSTSTSTTTTT